MGRKFKKIRGRHDDGESEYLMFHDIRSLLDCIDQQHQRMVDQAAEEAVQAAFLSLGEAGSQVH